MMIRDRSQIRMAVVILVVAALVLWLMGVCGRRTPPGEVQIGTGEPGGAGRAPVEEQGVRETDWASGPRAGPGFD